MQIPVVQLSQFSRECRFSFLLVTINESPYELHSLSFGKPFAEEKPPGVISDPRRGSTVGEIRALSDLDNISVGIADIAANFAVLGNWLRDELRSSTLP